MARPKTGKTGKPTNLYLAVDIKLQGTKIAHERYGISLSDMVERLLRLECSLKRGKLKQIRIQPSRLPIARLSDLKAYVENLAPPCQKFIAATRAS